MLEESIAGVAASYVLVVIFVRVCSFSLVLYRTVYKLSGIAHTVNTGVMWLSKNTLKSYMVCPLNLKPYYMNNNSSQLLHFCYYIQYIFLPSPGNQLLSHTDT